MNERTNKRMNENMATKKLNENGKFAAEEWQLTKEEEKKQAERRQQRRGRE